MTTAATCSSFIIWPTGGHALQPVKDDIDRITTRFQIFVLGQRRIMASANRALPLVHMACLADIGIERFPGFFGERVGLAEGDACRVGERARYGECGEHGGGNEIGKIRRLSYHDWTLSEVNGTETELHGRHPATTR